MTESCRTAMATVSDRLNQLNIDEPTRFTSARQSIDLAYSAMTSLDDDLHTAAQQLGLAAHLCSDSPSD